MNLRHTAAMALGGWSLITPPIYSQGDVVDERAPLSQWKTINSFDSAAQCRNYINNLQSAVNGRSLGDQTVIRRRKSLCISTDDPRLFQVEPLSSRGAATLRNNRDGY
jgi:hypothetical protein